MEIRTTRRLLIFSILVLLVGSFSFKLFEVFFVYNSGWKPLPQKQYPVTSVHFPEWEKIGSEADAWLEDARAELDTPALSAAISINGELIWAGAAGYADLDSGTQASVNTTFRIGSSSKAVTSIAMGVLLDEASVDLDAPISHYIADLSTPLALITTRQAMSHTGGVRDYGLCFCFPIWEYYNQRHFDSQREVLKVFEHSDLLFEPGKGFSYSSYGYNLTGAVIESITGLSFGDFLKSRVFDRLGLNGIRVDTGTPNPEDAIFYELRDGMYKPAFRVDNTIKSPSGGILATPTDMALLGQQMITPQLFSRDTRNLLIRHQPLASGQPNPQGYALGWRNHQLKVLDGAEETRVLHHHGVAYGSVSHFSVYPDHGIVISVMMNKDQGSFDKAPARLADMVILSSR